MRTTDTIAAISTALSPSGIGIVRMTGEDAVAIADKIYRGKKRLEDCGSHTINYGFIVDGDQKVDQVLVMLMRAPRTYTGEDTVEINCHGGPLVLQKVLELVLKSGAQLAEPGEFTRRAFLNGKMDLTQAEAVADIIDSGNSYILKTSMKHLCGQILEEISYLRSVLRTEIAHIEAALDDPEHYDLSEYPEELKNTVNNVKSRVSRLIEDSDAGIIMKSGIDTVILGKPNAGKSSVYNLLTRSEKAIVTDIAGTTRDILTDNIRMSGISLNITDTAGIRESEDAVEKIGVGRAKSAAEQAGLILCVLDGSAELGENDREVLALASGRKSIVLVNKFDLGITMDLEEVRKCSDSRMILFSAKDGTGLRELEEAVKEMFFRKDLDADDSIFITSVRQVTALKAAEHSLEMVLQSIDSGQPEDFFSIDLLDAYEQLGSITGETVGDEIIDEIFSRFCMGK